VRRGKVYEAVSYTVFGATAVEGKFVVDPLTSLEQR
jgi:hypothetical protein